MHPGNYAKKTHHHLDPGQAAGPSPTDLATAEERNGYRTDGPRDSRTTSLMRGREVRQGTANRAEWWPLYTTAARPCL
ncbi:hypothetical protein O1611_g1130 [Lasiodiplodia mahajangana]|uniref:Uncharacterized protein n=1 Tax=Lasiodiplodia mahajangana TaxID=1108764 RepID=A0ACC2JYD5_9PEZI|nr:hypothetical protein O1611_g1130 [Lasiodiplodia mahajangana]